MASFKETTTPQFNPYVSQQPIEAMAKVGMQKQQQYDTNVEKIYQTASNIAGLDILNDADKEYLDNQIGTLNTKLQVFAAGDFSSNNLTSSVRGMIGGIADDEVIRTAVSSTARVRNEVGKMSKAQESGESSIVNDTALNDQISSYMSATKPGQSFSGAYIPYIDVDTKLREVYESIEDTDITIDNPFQRNAQGETLYYASKDDRVGSTDSTKGERRIDNVMLKKSVKGKSAEKILNNFYTSLSADELRQLDMNGKFHYRGADAETFIAGIKEAGNTKKDFYTKTIERIAIELETNKNLSADEIKEFQKISEGYQTALNSGEIDKEMSSQIEALQDPNKVEALKASIYTDQYLRNMAINLETESVSIEYVKSEHFSAEMKIKDYNQKIREYQANNAHRDRMYGLALRKDLREEEAIADGQVYIGDPNTEVQDVNFSMESLQDTVDAIDVDIENLSRKAIPFINNAIKGPNAEQANLALVDKYYQEWQNGKTFDNAHLNEYFDRRKNAEVQRDNNTKLLEGVTRDPDVKQKQAEIDAIGNDHAGYDINGTYYSFNEILDLNNRWTKFKIESQGAPISVGTGGGGYQSYVTPQKFESWLASQSVDGRTVRGEEILRSLYQRQENNISNEGVDTIVQDVLEVGREYVKARKELKTAESDFIKKWSHKSVAKKQVLNKDNKKGMTRANLSIDQELAQAESLGGADVYDVESFDPDTIVAMRANDDTVMEIEKLWDGSGAITLMNPLISPNKQIIPLSSGELAHYYPQTTASSGPKEEMLASLRASNVNYTSNTKGIRPMEPGAALSAIHTGTQFPGIMSRLGPDLAKNVRFDIIGHEDNNESGADKYSAAIYVKHPGKEDLWIVSNIPNFQPLESIYMNLSNFGLPTYNQILDREYKKQGNTNNKNQSN